MVAQQPHELLEQVQILMALKYKQIKYKYTILLLAFTLSLPCLKRVEAAQRVINNYIYFYTYKHIDKPITLCLTMIILFLVFKFLPNSLFYPLKHYFYSNSICFISVYSYDVCGNVQYVLVSLCQRHSFLFGNPKSSNLQSMSIRVVCLILSVECYSWLIPFVNEVYAIPCTSILYFYI